MMPARIVEKEIMPKEPLETPETQDLEEMARQIDAALVEARRALKRSPAQVEKPDAPASNFGKTGGQNPDEEAA